MTPFCASDALSDNVVRVAAASRPADAQSEVRKQRATHVAVFEEERFRGVVQLREIGFSQPERIFIDLIAPEIKFLNLPTVSVETPLEEIARLIDKEQRDWVVVLDAQGNYSGIVTQQSLLKVLLKQTQEICRQKTREAEERFHWLLESTPDGMIVVDVAGKIVRANAHAETMFGYEPGELLEASVEDLLPDGLCNKHVVTRQAYTAHTAPRHMGSGLELRGYRKDNTEFPLEIALSPLQWDDEVLFAAAIRDITGRKRAEEKLRFTQFTVDRAADSIYWMTPDARFFYVNEAACRELGYTRKELLSMSVHDIDPDFPSEAWPKFWKQVRERGSFTIEAHHRTKDGRIYPVEVRGNYLEFEGQEYNCAIVRDISERKQTERALRLTQFSIDRAGDAAFWMAPDGRLLFVNDATCRSLGYSRDELLSMSVPDINPKFPAERLTEFWEEIKQRDSFTCESLHRRKDGSIFPVEITVNYLEFEGDDYNCAFARNITERKQTEEAARSRAAATARLALLSPREREVLELVVAGKASKIIARQLEISEKTVEKHRTNITKKLQVQGVADLVRLAIAATPLG